MSESAKVVSIRGGVVTPVGEPNAHIVRILRDALEKAENGEFCGVAVGTVTNTDGIGNDWAVVGGRDWSLVACARNLARSVEAAMFDGEHVVHDDGDPSAG